MTVLVHVGPAGVTDSRQTVCPQYLKWHYMYRTAQFNSLREFFTGSTHSHITKYYYKRKQVYDWSV